MAQARTLSAAEFEQLLAHIDTRKYAVRNRCMMLLTHWAGLPEFDTKRDKLLIHIGRASNLPLQEGQLCVLGRFSDVQSL